MKQQQREGEKSETPNGKNPYEFPIPSGRRVPTVNYCTVPYRTALPAQHCSSRIPFGIPNAGEEKTGHCK